MWKRGMAWHGKFLKRFPTIHVIMPISNRTSMQHAAFVGPNVEGAWGATLAGSTLDARDANEFWFQATRDQSEDPWSGQYLARSADQLFACGNNQLEATWVERITYVRYMLRYNQGCNSRVVLFI